MKKFLAFIYTFGVNFILSELKKFGQSLSEVPEMSGFVLGRVNDIENVVKLITDADPDNKKQLKKLFEENREQLTDDVLLLAAVQIEKRLGETEPEKAAYLSGVLRQIAAIDLFTPPSEQATNGNTALAAITTDFVRTENPEIKKGKKTGGTISFVPTEPEPHKIPASGEGEDYRPFVAAGNEDGGEVVAAGSDVVAGAM